MTHRTAPRLTLGNEAAGLVVMLDAAGRTIAELEHQVERLGQALAEERQQRRELADLLAAARQTAATADVPPSFTDGGEDETHDRPPATPA